MTLMTVLLVKKVVSLRRGGGFNDDEGGLMTFTSFDEVF